MIYNKNRIIVLARKAATMDFSLIINYLNLSASIITIALFLKCIASFLFKKLIHFLYLSLKKENEEYNATNQQ